MAARRQAEAEAAGRRDRHGLDVSKGLWVHRLGAAGELAVAYALDIPWSAGVNTFHGADLGRRLQVRARSKHSYDLIVRSDDNSGDIFVLVTGVPPGELQVHGWIPGEAAKHDRWRQTYGNRPPAFFVPQRVLDPDLSYLIMAEC